MDLDIDKLHIVLVDAGLPSSINDLKNPTEEYIVNLMTTFLTRFCIDVNTISKPTFAQQEIMSCNDDNDIVSLINLQVTMAQICDRIFFKDLCITDITSPGPKRMRKQAKFLANFILYTTNKKSDIQDQIDEILNKAKLLEKLIQKKDNIHEAINNIALHNAKQLSLKEKYKHEIEKMHLKIEENNNRKLALEAEMSVAEEKNQKAAQLCEFYKAEIRKLSKVTAELESEVVKCPDEYKTRLCELEEQNKLKIEERETVQEAIREKKNLIEQSEKILSFVQKQYDKLSEMKDIYKKSRNLNIQADNIKKQIETLQHAIVELELKLAMHEDQCGLTETNELRSECEERLSPLRNLYSQLLRDKKLLEVKLEKEQIRYNEVCLEKNKMQGHIKKLEEEISILIKSYQDLYNTEVINEANLRDIWKCY